MAHVIHKADLLSGGVTLIAPGAFPDRSPSGPGMRGLRRLIGGLPA